jgi:hypothetical protein
LGIVMPGLVPGIHVFTELTQEDVDGRDKPGHDERFFVNAMFTTFMRARFTNVFDGAARISAGSCVWRACIAD